MRLSVAGAARPLASALNERAQLGTHDAPLSQETRDFYDVSSKVPELKDVSLAPSGVVRIKSSMDDVGGEADYEVTPKMFSPV